MKQETKDKLKSFGKGVWGVLKFAFDILTYDSEEEEKKKRQEKEEQERLERERAEEEAARQAELKAKLEREEIAAKFASMSKEEAIAAALEKHDAIKRLEADNASLRRSNANLRSAIDDLEDENKELSKTNSEQEQTINDLEEQVGE